MAPIMDRTPAHHSVSTVIEIREYPYPTKELPRRGAEQAVKMYVREGQVREEFVTVTSRSLSYCINKGYASSVWGARQGGRGNLRNRNHTEKRSALGALGTSWLPWGRARGGRARGRAGSRAGRAGGPFQQTDDRLSLNRLRVSAAEGFWRALSIFHGICAASGAAHWHIFRHINAALCSDPGDSAFFSPQQVWLALG